MTHYSDLYNKFIELNPYFRRKLFKPKDLYKWFKELDISKELRDYNEFLIFLEYLFKENIITPFFKLTFPKEHKFHVRLFNSHLLSNSYQFNSWEELNNENLIYFVDNEEDREKGFEIKRIKHEIENNLFVIEESIYFYHPIQFLQLLTIFHYLQKTKTKLFSVEEFSKFFWPCWVEIENNVWIKSIRKAFEEKGENFDEEKFIEEKIKEEKFISKNLPYIKRYLWLDSKKLELWLKIESIFAPPFYNPTSPKPRIVIKRGILKDDEIEEAYNRDYKIQKKKIKNILEYFNPDDKDIINSFLEDIIYFMGDYSGFDSWFDILTQINVFKKEKLKGFLNYYINIFQIRETLEVVRWYLETDEVKKAELHPEFLFTEEKERNIYRQGLLIDYDLLAEKIFIIYVEGETEYYLMKEYFLFFRRRGHFDKIDVIDIKGKEKTDYTFSRAIQNFKDKRHFLLLDADSEAERHRKEKNLRKRGINEDNYHFFQPDFVSENFTIDEVITSYLNYCEFYDINLQDNYCQQLKEELQKSKENRKGFEDTIMKFEFEYYEEFNFPSFSKPKFAEMLFPFILEKKKEMVFEEALKKFYDKINKQLKKYYKRKGWRIS